MGQQDSESILLGTLKRIDSLQLSELSRYLGPAALRLFAAVSVSSAGSIALANVAPPSLEINAPAAESTPGSLALANVPAQVVAINAPASESSPGSITLYKRQALVLNAPSAESTPGTVEIYHEDAFVMVIDTEQAGSASDTFILPTVYSATYNATVDWGDGIEETITAYNDPNTAHIYDSPGIYTVTIKGTFGRMLFNNTGDKAKLLSVKHWGDVGFISFSRIFYGCSNLTNVPSGPITGVNTVGSFERAFRECNLLTIPAGLFDNCSLVTDFSDVFCLNSNLTAVPAGLFDNCPLVVTFNQAFYDNDITEIPTDLFKFNSAVVNFGGTFNRCRNLTSIPSGLFDNCPLVTSFSSVFEYCDKLTSIPAGLFDNNPAVLSFRRAFVNAPLTSIPAGLFDNNSLVTDFEYCFYNADITAVPSGLFDNCPDVTNVSRIFFNCNKLTAIPAGLFDNCTVITSFLETFRGCILLTTIPANLFRYNTLANTFASCFLGCTLSTASYSALLASLEQYNQNASVPFHGGNSTYDTAGAAARAALIADHGWTITDGGPA